MGYTRFPNGLSIGSVRVDSQDLTSTTALTAEESGKTCFLATAGGFVTTLPAPATGLKFKFVIKVAPTGDYTIVTSGSANIMIGFFAVHADGAGPTVATAGDTITFVAAGSAAKVGDWCEVESDGTSWYISGMSQIATGMTVTQAST